MAELKLIITIKNSKGIMFKVKISGSVWKHLYLYLVKISRDSGDP